MASIFTKIIEREIPADIEFENDEYIVIHDIAPQAKTHLLIIPKKEIPTINDISEADSKLIGDMFLIAKNIAKKRWIIEWYKLAFNVGPKWWQEVFHIHLHLLSDI